MKVEVPETRSAEMKGISPEATAPIFMSKEFYWPDASMKNSNASKTGFVIIQGMGAVRAGIWARSVCINENFKLGSMLPQVNWAVEKGCPVLVMNPNQATTDGVKVLHSQTMIDHCKHVWRNYVADSGL